MKKLLILSVFIIFVGILVYQFVKPKDVQLNVNPEQVEVVSEDETKSVCDKQLKSQPDNRVVQVFEGTSRAVDFTTLPEAKTYYTMITKSVTSGSNFAGHFTLAHWGCGTDCFQYAIVDAKTGEIVAYSSANVNYHLGDYGLDSRVLVLEPVYAGQERKYYKIVEEQGKSRLELVCTEISSKDMYGLPK